MTAKRIATLVGALSLLLALAVPAQAKPSPPDHAAQPERTDFPVRFIATDTENRLAIFWNITRERVCGPGGSPTNVLQQVDVLSLTTPKGAEVVHFQATRPLELWQLDDEVETPVEPLQECQNTEDQAGAWAKGHAHVSFGTNGLFATGPGTTSSGWNGQGNVTAQDGSRWHYSWVLRNLERKDGDIVMDRVVEKYKLTRSGG